MIPKQTILILEGPCAVGKSTIVRNCKDFFTLDDNYLEFCRSYNFTFNTLESQIAWITHWFTRIELLSSIDSNRTIITDRSPYSALCYVSEDLAERIKNFIDTKFKQYDERYNIICLYLRCPLEVKKQRIIKRATDEEIRDLKLEIERIEYENNWYDTKFIKIIPSIRVINTDESIKNIIKKIYMILLDQR